MNNKSTASQHGATSLHPVMWIAAIAVTALSMVGIAKMMGWVGTPSGAADEALVVAEAPASKEATADKPSASKEEQTKAPAKKRAGNTPSGGSDYAQGSGTNTQRVIEAPRVVCADCGVIGNIRTVEVPVEGSGVGAVAGGVLGGVVGNQFGKGSGKTAATVAGAVLGGVAGHKVEEHVRTKTIYEVSLRMEDGATRVIKMEQAPAYTEGQRVRVSGNQLLDAPREGSAQRL